MSEHVWSIDDTNIVSAASKQTNLLNILNYSLNYPINLI